MTEQRRDSRPWWRHGGARRVVLLAVLVVLVYAAIMVALTAKFYGAEVTGARVERCETERIEVKRDSESGRRTFRRLTSCYGSWEIQGAKHHGKIDGVEKRSAIGTDVEVRAKRDWATTATPMSEIRDMTLVFVVIGSVVPAIMALTLLDTLIGRVTRGVNLFELRFAREQRRNQRRAQGP